MAWLKYQLCYAEGYGPPSYVRARANPDEQIYEIDLEEGDGLRFPSYSVVDELPPEVLKEKIAHARKVVESWQRELASLLEEQNRGSAAVSS